MTEARTTTLSVRGEAQRDVDPDSARLDIRVRTIEATKAGALHAVGAQSRALLAILERRGGAVLTAADERRELGWVADGAVTWDEYEWRDDQRQPTGRTGAAVTIRVTARDFALIVPVADAFADLDLVHLEGVAWSVDHDNPAWSEVRAEAIAAAIAKGRDYASALGGELVRVEHVADDGLLDGRGGIRRGGMADAMSYKSAGDESESPPLDPSPQTVSAVIEARFAATVAAL